MFDEYFSSEQILHMTAIHTQLSQPRERLQDNSRTPDFTVITLSQPKKRLRYNSRTSELSGITLSQLRERL